MPQMAPLPWTPLFIYFSLVFLLIIAISHFISPPLKLEVISKTINQKTFNWKW
uniref:ATP synthase F0 subunit 8 n=1 Tax=Anchistus australis TaxID=1296376 RepID=UPI0013E9654A|nr:ATP synthase F0 subunit 8 [Anchistus australis]QHR79560.1 ATP synthase F0 subunit 8 [Anchistus australis]